MVSIWLVLVDEVNFCQTEILSPSFQSMIWLLLSSVAKTMVTMADMASNDVLEVLEVALWLPQCWMDAGVRSFILQNCNATHWHLTGSLSWVAQCYTSLPVGFTLLNYWSSIYSFLAVGNLVSNVIDTLYQVNHLLWILECFSLCLCTSMDSRGTTVEKVGLWRMRCSGFRHLSGGCCRSWYREVCLLVQVMQAAGHSWVCGWSGKGYLCPQRSWKSQVSRIPGAAGTLLGFSLLPVLEKVLSSWIYVPAIIEIMVTTICIY